MACSNHKWDIGMSQNSPGFVLSGRLLLICGRAHCKFLDDKLSMDNTINRTIRTIYRLLKNKGLSPIIHEFEAYDNYLCSMGVNSEVYDPTAIDNIKYTRLNAPYKAVMNLSRTILANYKAES